MADRLFYWVDVAGTIWPLNGETNYQAIVGPTGLYGIPSSIITQDIPMFPGTAEKYVQLLPSQPKVPIVIYAPTEQDLDTARRALKWAMAPSRGVGKLRHQANDGTIRELNCRLAHGWEGDESAGMRAAGAQWVDLQFFAADPFWYDTDYTQILFASGAGAVFLGSTTPFLPILLSPTGATGSATIDNTGEAVAWPVWTLTGPATSLRIVNNTTGDVLNLPSTSMATLTGGQTITIDTSPITGKTIIREDGSKHFEYLDPTSTLWGMAVGPNNITATVTGTTSASLLTLQYKRRYEGV